MVAALVMIFYVYDYIYLIFIGTLLSPLLAFNLPLATILTLMLGDTEITPGKNDLSSPN